MISKQQQNMAILDEEINYTKVAMEEMPTNLSLDKTNSNSSDQDPPRSCRDHVISEKDNTAQMQSIQTSVNAKDTNNFQSETRIQLSFSVDRLLSSGSAHSNNPKSVDSDKCCEEMGNGYSCCSLPNCTVNTSQPSIVTFSGNTLHNADDDCMQLGVTSNFLDFKSIVRPTPVRAFGNNAEQVNTMQHYSPLTPTSLIRFHQAQLQQKQMQQHLPAQPNFTLSSVMNPLCSMKQIATNGQQLTLSNFPPSNRFGTKSSINFDIAVGRPNLTCISNLRHHPMTTTSVNEGHMNFSNNGNSTAAATVQSGACSGNNSNTHTTLTNGKRKRSWSRAVFSNLQRKGLEIQFQQQKYITKPDRRKLAARLNLTDAQVKVWFQNRRMKWRHTRENLKSGQEKPPVADNNSHHPSPGKANAESGENQSAPGYSSDGSSSLEMSDVDEDDDEIDVVE